MYKQVGELFNSTYISMAILGKVEGYRYTTKEEKGEDERNPNCMCCVFSHGVSLGLSSLHVFAYQFIEEQTYLVKSF